MVKILCTVGIFDEGNINEIDEVLVIHKIFPTKYFY